MKIKPCPFCGTHISKARSRMYDNNPERLYWVQCGNPFCEVDSKTWEMACEKSAIEAWNERNDK